MKAALLLAPGAGASSESPALVAVERALDAHLVVRRMDFPYRLAGRKAPDRQPVLVEAVRAAASQLALDTGIGSERIFLGGRSMGGRICSIAVAEGLPAAGLVLMSYPLHPPGRPEKLRVDHFPSIAVPCLFVSGTRDTFGSPDEFLHHSPAIGGPVTHEWIEGGDHGMKKHCDAVSDVVKAWVTSQLA